MSVPTILFIGPFKSGTTWVQDYFTDRGDICLPTGVKETFFFDRNLDRGLPWYEAHFRHFDAARHAAICEVAPSYFHQPDVPGRIRRMSDDVRVVVLSRDPVDRCWSHYLHMRRKGYTRQSIRDAVAAFPSIVDASRLSLHVARWQSVLGTAAVIEVSFAQLARDPDAFAQTLSQRLGLPEIAPTLARHEPSNAAGIARSYPLARLARRTAEGLRRRKLYGVVNAAKAVGLKRLTYGGGCADKDPNLHLDPGTRLWLRGLLQDEYRHCTGGTP